MKDRSGYILHPRLSRCLSVHSLRCRRSREEEKRRRQLTKIPRHVICRGRRQPASQPARPHRLGWGAGRGRPPAGRPVAQPRHRKHTQEAKLPSAGLLRQWAGRGRRETHARARRRRRRRRRRGKNRSQLSPAPEYTADAQQRARALSRRGATSSLQKGVHSTLF